MAYIFDGKTFAKEKEEKLAKQVISLKQKGITPKLVSIIVGDDPASTLYVNLKKKAGERIGVTVEVISEKSEISNTELTNVIINLNEDKSVNGIMIQLPLPANFSDSQRDEIINSIAEEKDVDGLRKKSKFIHPTSKAVLEILEFSLTKINFQPRNVLIIGSTGMVGKPLVRELRKTNYKLWEANSQTANFSELGRIADVIISATGVENLVKSEWVKTGAVLIDVGSPKGDIEKAAYEKASFVSPVPGGVGPVTISCLLENLLESCLG